MMQQYQRLRFHIRMTFEDLKMRINPAWYESRAQELAGIAEQQEFRSLAEELDREYEEYIRSEPVLQLENTMLFSGGYKKRKCNFLTVRHYRRSVQKVYSWALEHGFDTFIVDESTPVGLLALEIFLALRNSGETFRLYALRTKYIGQRKSYRLISETNVELALMEASCDYSYQLLDKQQMRQKIISQISAWYDEKGLHVAEQYAKSEHPI